MISTKTFLMIGALCILIGAGCASSQPSFPEDATPGVNEENCLQSGGTVDGDACACPDGYFADPAGFCIDPQGKPGGAMRQ